MQLKCHKLLKWNIVQMQAWIKLMLIKIKLLPACTYRKRLFRLIMISDTLLNQ